ncbi:serine hydrolase domain-containing protein [Maricaulis sp. MIT060901]|uniref:serine hydrolase domain-containing protein n=1 Tax=Maricaulis sp. MIT060901 TaxID=3096993 RepID=UPI00399AB228
MNTITARACLSALAGAACLLSPATWAQSPSDFTSQLRPRFHVGEGGTRYSLAERMQHYNVPGVAVAVLADGEVVYAQGFGVLQTGGSEPVDEHTVFSAGSVSKIATSALTLRLHDAGLLDINAPVSGQLRSWELPQSAFDNQAVTLRTILSHTAGFNIHGFPDFQPGEELPSVYQTLNGEPPARHGALELTFEPGSTYRYSGGGFTLAQLIITDQTGTAFESAAETHLFEPLGMSRSSFANPLPSSHGNIARAHDRDGQPAALPRGYETMPEMAASGLWVSASDMGLLVEALIDAYRGDGEYLEHATAVDMMSRVARTQHGLGPRIEHAGDQYFFHHAGANNSYQSWVEGHLATGDGLVVLTNGARGNGLHMEIRNAVADTMGWQINSAIRYPQIDVPVEMLEAMTGRYVVDDRVPLDHRQQMVSGIFAMELEVALVDGQLFAGAAGGDINIPLVPVSPTRFVIDGLGMREGVAELEFHRDATREVNSMSFHIANASSHYWRNE